MDIVLFGIQGSGKGTQAKILAADCGYEIFEAGGELRRIAATDTPLGKTVKGYIDQGHLVPHEIIMKVVEDALLAKDAAVPLLFDGIPRDRDQMRDFDAVMGRLGRAFSCIELTVDERAAIDRIRKRALEQGRVDDASEEFIRRRIGLFHEKTRPVIEEYRRRGSVTTVNGEGGVAEVAEWMQEALRVPCPQ